MTDADAAVESPECNDICRGFVVSSQSCMRATRPEEVTTGASPTEEEQKRNSDQKGKGTK